MDIEGKLIDITFEGYNAQITFLVNFKQVISLVKKRGLNFILSITEPKKKRSLDANGYMWVLCKKISDELAKEDGLITKDEVYKDAVKAVGVFDPIIISTKHVERFEDNWRKNGLGFVITREGEQDKMTRLHCYYGSHTYTVKEMSRLINYLVELAHTLYIETKTDEEIQSLLKGWK